MSASNVSRILSPTRSIRDGRSRCADERLPDAVDDGELGGAPPRLVDQAGVLERHAEAPGERRQELLVGLGERVLAVQVLDRDDARGLAADDERHPDSRLRRLPCSSRRIAVLLVCELDVLVDHQRLARLHHVAPKADQRDRLVREADAALDRVGEAQQTCVRVVDADVDDLRVEDVAELVADEVVDGLQLELAGETLLDAVDECQLGNALPCLVQQPRPLQGGRDVLADVRQQLLVRVRVADRPPCSSAPRGRRASSRRT